MPAVHLTTYVPGGPHGIHCSFSWYQQPNFAFAELLPTSDTKVNAPWLRGDRVIQARPIKFVLLGKETQTSHNTKQDLIYTTCEAVPRPL